jgi:ubiquinone/menaquinone biosynthesis C-methylase UbiE
MPTLKHAAEYGANLVAHRLGYEFKPWRADEKSEGFMGYCADARRRGMDVNDYEEQVLGWTPARPLLEKVLFPLLRPAARVIDVGPGTGRQARHIAPRVADGELHLVDHSPFLVDFLSQYFRDSRQVHAHLNEGYNLPFSEDNWADVVFCGGTIIALNLGTIDLYAREFHRVLKPGGWAVFDYIDPDVPEGAAHLRTQTPYLRTIYTYHAATAINRVFGDAGFVIGERHQDAKSTYLTVRKR